MKRGIFCILAILTGCVQQPEPLWLFPNQENVLSGRRAAMLNGKAAVPDVSIGSALPTPDLPERPVLAAKAVQPETSPPAGATEEVVVTAEPVAVPACELGPHRVWFMAAGTDLEANLRRWADDAGLHAFNAQTDDWKFPVGQVDFTFEGCFGEAVTQAVSLFERYRVRPKVVVDKDNIGYLTVFEGFPK